jgi:hypothetical protein
MTISRKNANLGQSINASGISDTIYIANNNVGINVSNPLYQLDVAGTGNFSQGIFVNGTGVSIGGHSHNISDINNLQSTLNNISTIQGTQGVQGIIGTQGIQGLFGIQGFIGSQGTTGSTGSQGVQGITGSQGVQGITGSQGAVGSQGVQGITGSQGVTGSQGITGPQGTIGATGPVGQGFSDGNKGDITISNGGATLSINADSVTTVDIANGAITTSKLDTNITIDCGVILPPNTPTITSTPTQTPTLTPTPTASSVLSASLQKASTGVFDSATGSGTSSSPLTWNGLVENSGTYLMFTCLATGTLNLTTTVRSGCGDFGCDVIQVTKNNLLAWEIPLTSAATLSRSTTFSVATNDIIRLYILNEWGARVQSFSANIQ